MTIVQHNRRPLGARLRRRSQAGFTLVEVLVAIAVFAVAIVGLVAIEGRSVETQRASAYIREGERVAQDVMAELKSRSFVDLLTVDFAGNDVAAMPYDDTGIDIAERRRDFRRVPADLDEATDVIGSVRGSYVVFRTVDWVIDPDIGAPPIPIDLTADLPAINALVLQVTVLWIDDSAVLSALPSNADSIDELLPEMADPTNAAFLPTVGSVTLRTVRANDTVVQ